MDPQSVTQLALLALGIAGFAVAVTGVMHLRRGRSTPASSAPASSADGASTEAATTVGSADSDEDGAP